MIAKTIGAYIQTIYKLVEFYDRVFNYASRINFRMAWKMAQGLFILFILIISGLSFYSLLPIEKSIELFVIQSGSMEPAISTGSLVISKPASEYRVGDIITYGITEKNFVTHRISEMNENGSFLTKGDANDTADSNPINVEKVKGKVLLSIPLVGYPIGFAKTFQGLILMIVIPATIIVYEEFLSFKQSLTALIKSKYAKNT